MLGLDPPGSAALEIPERRILRSLPAQFENREYWGTGRQYRRPRPDAHQLAIAEKPYSHTLSTARRGKTQLIEHKVIVYFLRTAPTETRSVALRFHIELKINDCSLNLTKCEDLR